MFDPSSEEKADIVIADLPCSGIGFIGRKPDIKYHMTEESLKALEELQRQILSVVWRYVKPGGTLIYSTCTINKGENEKNASWIRGNLPFEPVDIKRKAPGGMGSSLFCFFTGGTDPDPAGDSPMEGI